MKPRLAAAVLLSFAALAPAGSPAREGVDNPCPTITVSCPDGASPGKPATYRVSVSGADPSVTPTFKWSVSSGKIISGQGTAEIQVESHGSTQTATVEVGGYPSLCATTVSCTLNICKLPPSARKVDEYGEETSLWDEKARLGSFAQELLNDPTATGYVIAYAGRRARRDGVRRLGERAKDYLVNGWGIAADRVFAVDGGRRERRAVELFVAPAGAAPPLATPAVKPAVKRPGENRR